MSGFKLTLNKFAVFLQNSEWGIGITTFAKIVLNNKGHCWDSSMNTLMLHRNYIKFKYKFEVVNFFY